MIKDMIELYKVRALVNDIVELLFDGGEYFPELYDYAFWVTISDAYAGIGSDMEVDEFMHKLYADGWMDELVHHINPMQLDAITEAVEERIQLRLNKNPLEPLAGALTDLFNGLGELLKDYKDLNADEIKRIIDAVKNMKEINAENLVEAYIKNQK